MKLGNTTEKLCLYLIVPYVIILKGHKENLNIIAVTMIEPVTVWFKITKYGNKRAIQIAELVEPTWLTRYPRPMEITYGIYRS